MSVGSKCKLQDSGGKMKRYSIVRVDGECPKGFNEDIYCKWCGNCGRIYGDTKEQFTRKIETAIEIAINEYEKGNIPKGKENRRCAEIIVEFLGVE